MCLKHPERGKENKEHQSTPAIGQTINKSIQHNDNDTTNTHKQVDSPPPPTEGETGSHTLAVK